MDIQLLYSRRIEAASVAAARGDRAEAERLYAEALTMGEEKFGATSPQLAVPLNELSRLYVHASAHAQAEPLLKRLLEIRRADGENHPAVATVLAALAAVRRGLGDHAAAEDLYRRALAIREVAHGPDHMAVVVVVEQLADTCAARGKFAEAKTLLERALPVREKAMGAEHATVRGLRDRMAEFALKASPVKREAPVATPAPAPAPAPVPAPTPIVADAPASNQLVFIYEPEKPVRRASVKRDRANLTPPFSSMAMAAASIIAAPAQVTASQPPAATQVATPSLALTPPMDRDAPVAPRANVPRAERGDARQPQPRRAFAARADVFAEEPRSRARPYAYAAMAMTALAGALFVIRSMMSSEPPAVPVAVATERPQVVAPVPPSSVPAASVGAAAFAAVARPDSAHAPIAAPPRQPLTSTASRRTDVVDVPRLPGALPKIGDVALPVAAVASADSAIRAATNRRDTNADQLLSTARLKSPSVADERAESSPVLIGSVPQPRFPEGLRSQRYEGSVIVRFLVGEDGRVDGSSMQVVRSPHELFTSAVRAVLPRFRFEPARSAEAKPRAEWVQYGFEFSATK